MFECTQIICKVENIKKAVSNYIALGFSVEWGAAPKKAHNAFIWFEDGPNIELFQVPKYINYLSLPIRFLFGKQVKNRFSHWYHSPEGLCCITIGPSDRESRLNLKNIFPILCDAGLNPSRIIKGSRIRPDGQKVKYSFIVPLSEALPLVASWYDPPQHPDNINHPNGAKCVKSINVGVSKDDWDHYQFLTDKEKRICIEPALKTSVLNIGISGLKKNLDTNILHGAVIENIESK